MQTIESVLYEIGCGIYPSPDIDIDFEQYVRIEDQALKNVTDWNSLEILNYLDKWPQISTNPKKITETK